MNSFKRALALVLTLLFLSLPFLVFFKAQALVDWWQLHDYTAPASVVQLAQQDSMTTYAAHVFYVNHPKLETDTSQFRADCNESEKTIVLGCYHGNQDGIFIYSVSDPRLGGVQQVTAAHEMLHAAYDRLSSKDRNYVDGLLQNYYSTVTDQRIIDTINSYKQSEPNDVVNEMHSVFGTEIANLPQPLNDYYQKYFTDRQKIAGYASSYEGEFTSREDQIKADDAQLARMKADITAEENLLDDQLAKINSDRGRLNSERGPGNIERYNSDVAGFNAEVNAYNAGVDKLKSDIASYNDLVNTRNDVAHELAGLAQAIDTRLTTQPVQ